MSGINFHKFIWFNFQAKACSEELKFHQAVYHLQIKYMESLFNAVR